MKPITKELVTVYFSDIVGFTTMSSEMSADKVRMSITAQDSLSPSSRRICLRPKDPGRVQHASAIA